MDNMMDYMMDYMIVYMNYMLHGGKWLQIKIYCTDLSKQWET